MNREELDARVGRVAAKLPPMPGSISKLLHVAADRDATAADMLPVIEQDPGLAAELLRLANTCFRRGGSIESLGCALAHVGTDAFVATAAASFLDESLESVFSGLEHVDSYARHSREIAKTCGVLCDVLDLGVERREEYRAAGIIHDVGRLIMLIAANRPAASLIGSTPEYMTTVLAEENRAMGLNHCRVGRQLCRTWKLPGTMEEGVLRHHTPLVSEGFSYPGALIFVAHFVASSDFTGEIIDRIVPRRVLSELGLSAPAFDRAQHLYREGDASGRGRS